MVSFSSQLNIQHHGGIHDTVILDELIDKSALGGATGNPGGLFNDTSQVLMEETLINEFDKEPKSPVHQTQRSRPQSGIPRLSKPPSMTESVNLG